MGSKPQGVKIFQNKRISLKNGKIHKKQLTWYVFRGMISLVECGGIAQLARAHGSYPWCRWFKSSSRYYFSGGPKGPFFFYTLVTFLVSMTDFDKRIRFHSI